MYPQPHIALAPHVLPTLEGQPIRVLVAGPDSRARSGLTAMLDMYDDLSVEQIAVDGRLSSRLSPSSVDVLLGDASSNEVIEMFARLDVPSVLLIDDRSLAPAALATGARGVLLRDASPRRIHAALRAVSEGMVVVDERLSGKVVAHSREAELLEPLTHREGEVVQLLADGLTNKEIATRLGISDHTVKFHVNGILGKLGVETRTEAVVHAARLGIVVL
ncbi:MAG: response regulator transcription factor [Acidobacteriota bacterium]